MEEITWEEYEQMVASLIAMGYTWTECEHQINESKYTGTTWEVYFDSDPNGSFALFFTDLGEARRFATSITADRMNELFGNDAEGQLVRIEEDEWFDGENCELGFATWYGYHWLNGKWVEMDY